MTVNLLARFINEQDYDIRKTYDGRWIDQKCAFDTVCFVADCIVDYIREGGLQPFTSPSIWKSMYAGTNVQKVFGKPDPTKKSVIDEYNKFFRQPMKMLAAAGVLRENGKIKNAIQFSIEKMEILEYIALRERNAIDFMCLYIEKTLQDSDLWDAFETFFDEQTQDSLAKLRYTFMDFCFKHTPIEKDLEPKRIFTKVLNHLAWKQHKKGTINGRISQAIITYDKIVYNRANWRDERAGKNKNVSRGDFVPTDTNENMYKYRTTRAKKYLRQFNDKYNAGKSEKVDRFSVGELATHMHHIFPVYHFKEIADYIENIIALTSAQHMQCAHPNGDTSLIDEDYQHQCLICKTDSIRTNIIDNKGEPVIYSFEDFMLVLDVGLRTDYFGNLPLFDFNSVLTGIEMNY